MDNIIREKPPTNASEIVMLGAFLDYHRATLLQKMAGLSDSDLRRGPMTEFKAVTAPELKAEPGITLLGLVKHLAYVERWWFQAVFGGREVFFPWSEADPDADWRVEPDETTAQIRQLYKEETVKSRQIVADTLKEAGNETAAMKTWAKNPGFEQFSLRWVIIHMIEETARHNGHADILREAIDGVTGL